MLIWLILTILAIYVLIYVWFAAQLIAYPYEIDQGEGYDVWSGWLIASGQLPYSDNAAFPYYSSNYPPLWSAVVAVPMHWLGPALAPARVVSAVATLLAAAVIGLGAASYARALWRAGRSSSRGEAFAGSSSAVLTTGPSNPPGEGTSGLAFFRAMPAPLTAGLLAAGFFLASPYVYHTTALARVNSLATLLALAALALVETGTRRRIALGALALLASLFTKPTAIDAATAAIGFLLLTRPRSAAWALAVLLGLGGLGLAVLLWMTRGAFWLNVVAGNANPFDLEELGRYVVNFSAIHAVIAVIAFGEALRALRARAWSPWALYVPLAALMGLSVGKWGAGESYLLGLIAGCSVLAGARVAVAAATLPAVFPSWGRGRESWLGAALLLQMLLFAHGPVSDAIPLLPDRGRQGGFLGRVPSAEDRANGDRLVELLRMGHRPDAAPVLSEAPSFVIAAGQPVVGNATHLRNLYDAGLWSPDALVADVRGRRFGFVVLNAQLYPAPVLSAIGASYYLAQVVRVGTAEYQVFLPGAD